MTPEAKALEKIRNVLINDQTLADMGMSSKTVYASHISSITEPVFPCISLFLLSSRIMYPLDEIVQVRVQLDAWFTSERFTTVNILECLERIRSLLHRKDLTDTVIGMISYSSIQALNGPLLYEEDTQLFHLPSIYEMVVK